MSSKHALSVALVAAISLGSFLAIGEARTQDKQVVQIPKPGVPQIMTLEGRFVRAAYNNEGYVILGYQASNRSVGEDWMLLEVGMTLIEPTKDYTLTRDKLSLDTPDGKHLPLPTIEQQRDGSTQAIQQRANVQRDSINYFPNTAYRGCGIGFFPNLGARALPQEQVEMSSDRACVGRLFFKIPGGIAYGQYWLNVQFRNSLVRAPFRILTEDEEKFLDKNYKSIEQQVKDAFRPKK